VPVPPPESGVIGKAANMFAVEANNKSESRSDFVFIILKIYDTI
jgi:hypothetical protein